MGCVPTDGCAERCGHIHSSWAAYTHSREAEKGAAQHDGAVPGSQHSAGALSRAIGCQLAGRHIHVMCLLEALVTMHLGQDSFAALYVARLCVAMTEQQVC